MEFFVILLLTLLNGAFAMSELALTASRKVRLQALADAGDAGAAAALQLLDNPTQFLSVVQVGITSIGMLNAIVGEAAFGAGLALWFGQTFSLSPQAASITATVLLVTVITFITIVFGELVPKRIGQLYPETVARAVAIPMTWIATITKPFVRLLTLCTQGILALLRINTADTRGVTEAEITASLEEGVDAGIIEQHEHRMVRNVFHLDDRALTSMMLPRSDIQWFDTTASVAQCLQVAGTSADKGAHSWYPVCRGSLDHVVGIVRVARLIDAGPAYTGALESLVEPATFVPETLSGMELIEQFRVKSARMVFVVDEYGIVQGLMTPMDLLEAITGELQPDTHTQAWAVEQADGSWHLDGLMPVNELKARLAIEADLPLEDRGRYNTLAGLLMMLHGALPAAGDRIACAGWEFAVLVMDGRRIDQVRASRLVPTADL